MPDESSQPAVIPQVPPSPSQPTHPDVDKDTTPRWKKNLEIGAFGVAVGLLLLNGGLFWVGKKSADAARDAADIASRTMKLTYRPRITLLGINPSVMQTMKDGKLITTLDKGRLQVGINSSNTGPIAARNVRFFRFDNLGSRDQLKKLPYEELMGEPKVIPPNTTGYNGQMTIFGSRAISKDELTALQAGNLWATFSIMIVYDDDFGETHHTEYCDIFTLQSYNDICPWPVQND